MRATTRLAAVTAIGLGAAWLWIRFGLYGFGLPVGLVTLTPLALAGILYARTRRIADLGLLLGAFAAAWTAFETWMWLNASSDPAVWIPSWTPIPLATAVALLILATTVAIAAALSKH